MSIALFPVRVLVSLTSWMAAEDSAAPAEETPVEAAASEEPAAPSEAAPEPAPAVEEPVVGKHENGTAAEPQEAEEKPAAAEGMSSRAPHVAYGY